METRLQQFCLNTQQIEQMIYSCEQEMTIKEQDTLRIRESYIDCTSILLQMAVKVGNNQTEFQQLSRLVDLSFKKMLQVIRFYSEKPRTKFDNRRQNVIMKGGNDGMEEEWMDLEVAFGDNMIDKHGNLIKQAKPIKRVNIHEQLQNNSHNLIFRLKQNTSQKIQSLNTHIITNELKELNKYFDHCKNNCMQFFIDQNKYIDEIWKKSKQDYEPTMEMMEIWKGKLEYQLDELRAKMSQLEKELARKIEQIKLLRQRLDAYNVRNHDNATQTPGLYDYRLLELNQHERLIHIESKRLYDLIFSYQSMLKEEFKVDDSRYKRIKEEMVKSMERIRSLEFQNLQMKEEFEKQNESCPNQIYNDCTFELLKELRTMPAFQREMYNSTIVKFINAIKKMSKQSTTQEMRVKLELQGQSMDIMMDKKMFIYINQQQKTIIGEIQKRRSKIAEFNIGKVNQVLDGYKKKVEVVVPGDEMVEFQSRNRKSNKMRSLELKGKKMTVMRNEKIESRQPTQSRIKTPSSRRKQNQVSHEGGIEEDQSLVFSSLSSSTKRLKQPLKKVEIESSMQEGFTWNQSQSKKSISYTSKYITQEASRQKDQRSNQSSQQKHVIQNPNHYKKKSSITGIIQNSIIIEQPLCENIKTDPIRSFLNERKSECFSISIQTDEVKVKCTFCEKQIKLSNLKQLINVQQNIQSIINAPKQENNALKSSKAIKAKETRLWTPHTSQAQPTAEVSRIFQKQPNLRMSGPKFILNQIKQPSRQKQSNKTLHKLSFNVEPLTASQIDNPSASVNSTMLAASMKSPSKVTQKVSKPKSEMANKLLNVSSFGQLRKSIVAKNFRKNNSNNFHSLFEQSLSEFKSPKDFTAFQDLSQLQNCNEIETILAKFKLIHAGSCKEKNCTHLARFYENLKKIESINKTRKSPMVLKTLNIQRIDHI